MEGIDAGKVTELRVSERLVQRNAELEKMFSEACTALKHLSEMKLEQCNLRDHAIAQHGEDEDELAGWYQPEDEDAPFFTEGWLYPMLGKEDARTVLAVVRGVQRALGLPQREYV